MTFLSFSPPGGILGSRRLGQFSSKTLRNKLARREKNPTSEKRNLRNLGFKPSKGFLDFPWVRGMAEESDSCMDPEEIAHLENSLEKKPSNLIESSTQTKTFLLIFSSRKPKQSEIALGLPRGEILCLVLLARFRRKNCLTFPGVVKDEK